MLNQEDFPSPDGRFVLELGVNTMGMSHEVYSPYLFDKQRTTCLFNAGTLWDASAVEWSDDSLVLRMNLRHYSNGRHYFVLSIEPENDYGKLSFEDRTIFSGALANLSKEMDNIFEIDDVLNPSWISKLFR